MNFDNDGTGWDFKHPTSCTIDQPQLRDLKKPYNGPHLTGSILRMPIPPNNKKGKSLRALQAESTIKVPDSFSWRKIGADQIETARDQKLCGSCWSFAISTVLGDRFALKNQIQAPKPSPAWFASLGTNIDNQPGCQGAVPWDAALSLENGNGIKLESCWSYDIISDNQKYGGPGIVQTGNEKLYVAPNPLNTKDLSNCCYNCCGDKVSLESQVLLTTKKGSTKYFGQTTVDQITTDYNINDINNIIRDIQIEIMSNGPVACGYSVQEDFMNYWSNNAKNGDVFIPKTITISEQMINGHEVVITGWGVQNGIKFWEIRNSWGATGDNGYCKIAFASEIKPEYRIGIDIPIIIQGTFFGGVISFDPSDLSNLNDLISKGVFKKSTAGNLLNNPQLINPGGNNGGKPSNKESTIIYYIIAVVFVLVVLLIVFLYRMSTRELSNY
jgi:hypothetical protein